MVTTISTGLANSLEGIRPSVANAELEPLEPGLANHLSVIENTYLVRSYVMNLTVLPNGAVCYLPVVTPDLIAANGFYTPQVAKVTLAVLQRTVDRGLEPARYIHTFPEEGKTPLATGWFLHTLPLFIRNQECNAIPNFANGKIRPLEAYLSASRLKR